MADSKWVRRVRATISKVVTAARWQGYFSALDRQPERDDAAKREAVARRLRALLREKEKS